MNTEILHQTANLSLRRTAGKLEVCLEGNTHAVVVGAPASEELGRRFIERAENPVAIRNLRKMHQ